jgi:hypothetical protein
LIRLRDARPRIKYKPWFEARQQHPDSRRHFPSLKKGGACPRLVRGSNCRDPGLDPGERQFGEGSFHGPAGRQPTLARRIFSRAVAPRAF